MPDSSAKPAVKSDTVSIDVQKWVIPTVRAPGDRVFHNEDEESAAKETGSKPVEEVAEAAIPTAEEIETWHQQAHEEGFQEGYQKGLQQAEQETRELQQQLASLITFLQHPLDEMNEQVEQQLTLLATTLAQQLVRRELRSEPGEIVAIIRESIKLLPINSRQIVITLHPDDADIVRQALQIDDTEEAENWRLVEDPMITRGGCEIKSDQSVINATLENRLQALAASVLGGDRQDDPVNSA